LTVADQRDSHPSSPPSDAGERGDQRAANVAAQAGRWSWRSFTAGFAVAILFCGTAAFVIPSPRVETIVLTGVPPADGLEEIQVSSLDEVLGIAADVLDNMRKSLDDYTAIIVKQETVAGVLTEPTQMAVKVMCTHRGGKADESEPMRVYLRFLHPSSVAGREVIWASDRNGGNMVVHEAGILGLLTLQLDPLGMIAMRGQRYPITEIGLTKMVQKLIERGQQDRDNPDVRVTIRRGLELDDMTCDLVTVHHAKPTGKPDDFSRAEICFDTVRKLPIRYTAYGWSDDEQAPLIESYTYRDIKTNVGLTEADFDPKNPDYKFP